MEQTISRILRSYERGKVSRRQLVGALTALAASTTTGRAAASTFQGVEVNHIALRVTDVKRSRDFYQKHLGLPVVREGSGNCFLGLGTNFLALFEGREARMDHYCIAIKDYEVGRVTAELQRQGLNPRQPGGSSRVYFDDPDGLEVQLAAAHHQP